MKKYLLIAVSIIMLTASCTITTDNKMRESLEMAYFEGQRDALNGDVRIARNSDSCYYWTKSPWTDLEGNVTSEPIFNPSNKCSDDPFLSRILE